MCAHVYECIHTDKNGVHVRKFIYQRRKVLDDSKNEVRFRVKQNKTWKKVICNIKNLERCNKSSNT